MLSKKMTQPLNENEKKQINDNILKCDKASYTYGIVFPIYRPLGYFNTGCLISQPRLQKRCGMCEKRIV